MKYIIAGRSGCGKTELAKRLENKGLKILKTYTTRPPRSEEDAKKYHFITPEQVKNYPDRVLEAEFFGATYFADSKDVRTADAMILEPTGVFEIIEKFPNTQFCLIYIQAGEPEVADARAIARADDKDAEREAIRKRRAGEDEHFGPLEEMLKTHNAEYLNLSAQVCENDFQPETLDKFAANMTGKLRKNNNFLKILNQLVALGAFNTDEKNKVTVELPDSERQVSLDIFAELFVDQDETFAYIIRSWLTHEIDFKIPGEFAPKAIFKSEVTPE